MSSPPGLAVATLLSLTLLGNHLAASAPTHPTPDHTEPSLSTGALTTITTTTAIPTANHRSSSHPIWHLLLALWRPKDATGTSALSPTEGDTFLSSSKKSMSRGYAAKRTEQHSFSLPYAARQIQLLPVDGSMSNDDPETQANSSTTTTNTPQHSTSDPQQQPDTDTPHHPTLNSKQKSDSSTAQHSTSDTHQHPNPETQQHPKPDTSQHESSEVQVSLNLEKQPHIAADSLAHFDPEKQDESDTQQQLNSDTPQHPTRNSQQEQVSRPQQHQTLDILKSQDSDTVQHPIGNSDSNTEHHDSDTPQHPTRNTKPKSGSSNPQEHSVPETQEEHLDPDTPEHPTRKTQQHLNTQRHQTTDTLQDSATFITPNHPTSNIQQKPPPQHPPMAIQQHSSGETQQHTSTNTDTQHTASDTQQHPDLGTHIQHPSPDNQEDPELTPPHHPTRNTQQQHEVSNQTQKTSQLNPPNAPLHPPRPQSQPTNHTQLHPVLYIDSHTPAQADLSSTQQPQLLPGTPWRLPHSDLSDSPPPPALQEDGSEPSPHASPPVSSVGLAGDMGHEEPLDGRMHNESSHPYPGAGRAPDEDEDPPTEVKLDDHFFLHPMPHHRDAMIPVPTPGHSDTLSTSSSSVNVAQDLSSLKSNFSEGVAEAVETEEIHVRSEPPIHVEERLDDDRSALHSERGKKVMQLQGPVLMESLDDSSLVPLVGQPKEMLTLKDNETTVLAMLKIAQTSGSSRDTLQTNAMIQSEDLGGLGDGRYTKFSHRDELVGLEAGTSGTTTAKLIESDAGGHDKAVLIKKEVKSSDTRKTVNAIDNTAEKNQLDVVRRQEAANLPTTMKPIYEEISGVLKVDTSIDDVEDFDVQIKHTEISDDFIQPANTSHINLIDVSLHSQDPLDLLDITESSFPTTLPSSTPTDPQTRQTSTPQTFTKYPNHYPPKLSFETNSPITNVSASEGVDAWPQFVANISDLNNGSLTSNASLIQRSHVLTLEEHYKLVLRERGSLMLQLMDPSADPCEDFYQFACGRWNGKFPIRQDKAVDNTFERLKEDLDDVLRSLLEEDPLPTDNNITTTVKTLYSGCMNTEAIEARGAEPLVLLLQELGGWPVLEGDAWNNTEYDWVRQMAHLRNYNNDILISEWVAADITNSSNHIIQLDQPELGLPGREYFINPGDYQYREAYLDLMLNVAQMLGAQLSVALKDMTDVLHFETHLSRILMPAEERRNLSAVHRRLTIEQLSEEVPEIDWAQYLDIVTWHNNHTWEVVVFGLDYFKKLVSFLEYTDDRTISNYLLWRFVKNRISNLGERYIKVKQDYIKVVFGRQSQPERWRSCVTYVNGNLGNVVGAMFVKKYFPEASKNDTNEMIGLIRESFGSALQEAHWMKDETRNVAQEKVDTIVKNVGYPEYLLNDTFMDQVYANLNFDREAHFDNVLKILQFHTRTNHELLAVPVNRNSWVTPPAVVNAYYSRSKNMIVFPAGILQPPFYHPAFPRSLNYGGIGVVIGHEITHGFDDRGRQFDKNGNLQQWWTPGDESQFYQRASCMLDQYGEYEVEEVGLKINPLNTLGENIADNAGIKISYQAYQDWRKTNEETVMVPFVNLTHDQLFFLNFGQMWCEINSPEAMLTKIRSGQHSPNRFRVIGTLSNSEEFSEAFSCPLESAMNPERKCRVW